MKNKHTVFAAFGFLVRAAAILDEADHV